MPHSSPPLADIQRWLRWAITDPRGPLEALKATAPDSHPRLTEPLPRRLEAIANRPPVLRDERIGVYADAYFIRLSDSLAADFCGVRRALGLPKFQQLVADYLPQHPSDSYHIGDLGRGLPEFIRTHPISIEFPFLHDLARLEWATLQSLYAERWPDLDPAMIAAVDPQAWPTARLRLDPTTHLMETDWPVDQLWQDRTLSEENGQKTLRQSESRWLIVYRDLQWVRVRAIDHAQWFALDRLHKGVTLEETCAELAGAFKDEAERLPVFQWFQSWANEGILKMIDLETVS
jgi:hypothetical protein